MAQLDEESGHEPCRSERQLAFRRRVVLARAAGGFETAWVALWPSLAVIGGFLVVSLLGVWALLPGWLHGLLLLGFAAGLGWTLWRARAALRWPSHVPGCAGWSGSTR